MDRRRREDDGVLPVDKPEGPTSHDVVARVRKALATRRVGHTGTLDPFASGLLLLCVGPATRLAEYLTDLPKRYEAVARLGVTTDTDDRTGAVLERTDAWRELSMPRIESAFAGLVGELLQVPPSYSAKKVGGERLYQRARRGETVRAEPVPVRVRELLVSAVRGPEVAFTVECSSGTYVRALARDAGQALGVGAHLVSLRRTAIGSIGVEGALSLEELADPLAVARAWLLPLEALRHLPRLDVSTDQVRILAHGGAIPPPAGGLEAGRPVLLASGDRLVAIGVLSAGLVRPRKVFADA